MQAFSTFALLSSPCRAYLCQTSPIFLACWYTEQRWPGPKPSHCASCCDWELNTDVSKVVVSNVACVMVQHSSPVTPTFLLPVYPCPLYSVRRRQPLFGEIGHTIMRLLVVSMMVFVQDFLILTNIDRPVLCSGLQELPL